jgi:hypothetical protein
MRNERNETMTIGRYADELSGMFWDELAAKGIVAGFEIQSIGDGGWRAVLDSESCRRLSNPEKRDVIAIRVRLGRLFHLLE